MGYEVVAASRSLFACGPHFFVFCNAGFEGYEFIAALEHLSVCFAGDEAVTHEGIVDAYYAADENEDFAFESGVLETVVVGGGGVAVYGEGADIEVGGTYALEGAGDLFALFVFGGSVTGFLAG